MANEFIIKNGAKVASLEGTGTRVTTASSAGILGAIANTTDGYVLTLVSGAPQWNAPAGGSPALTQYQIGIGSASNLMTGDSNFLYTAGMLTAKATFGSGTTFDNTSYVNAPLLLWYPKKAAFRAGYSTTYWNESDIGNYSVAMGETTKASGASSFAMGENAVASNTNAIAMGSDVTASGVNSVNIGGRNTTVSGQGAFGCVTDGAVTGNYAFAANDANFSYGESSFTLGFGNYAWTSYGGALGGSNVAGHSATSGGTADQYMRCFAIGYGNRSYASDGIALGYGNHSSAANGIAIGMYTQASATKAIAIGYGVNDTDRMNNSTANSLGVGFFSDVPTFIVGPASGTGTYGLVTVQGQLKVNGLTYTFPSSHATSGYVLTNDGSGTLTWAAVSGGVSDGDKGDITVASSGASWTIDTNAVTLAKMAQVATATFLGRVSASTGNVEALTGTQATTLLDTFTSTLKGLAPASGGGTNSFLRADATWATLTKRNVQERVTTLTDASTVSVNGDTTEIGQLTFTSGIGTTRLIGNPSGTPYDGQKLVFRFIQDGTGSRVVTWDTSYRFAGGTAPTLTTTASKTDYVGFQWNATASKWDNIAGTALNF